MASPSAPASIRKSLKREDYQALAALHRIHRENNESESLNRTIMEIQKTLLESGLPFRRGETIPIFTIMCESLKPKEEGEHSQCPYQSLCLFAHREEEFIAANLLYWTLEKHRPSEEVIQLFDKDKEKFFTEIGMWYTQHQNFLEGKIGFRTAVCSYKDCSFLAPYCNYLHPGNLRWDYDKHTWTVYQGPQEESKG